jgi:hypothetical protein
MAKPRNLQLKTERLAELSTDELHRVNAGQATLGHACVSLLTNCPSVNYCTTAMSCTCSPTWNCQ